MPRVAAVDPGTISFDLCVLEDGEPVVERTFASAELDPDELIAALREHGPYDLVYGPSGYGLPLVPAERVGKRELAEMVLVRRGEAGGVRGMRRLLRALVASGLPVIFGPGAIHLPTVPPHRKYNRIDIGTADKVCSAAWAIADQAARRGVPFADTSLILLELGGAFSAALAVRGGQIVDGLGGSSGPIGARAAGALDGELAYLLGPALTKETLFSGGSDEVAALAEGALKAVGSLSVSVPDPDEIVVSGRQTARPDLMAALGDVVTLPAGAASAAARGGALLADGLAGGTYAPLVEAMRLREASGSALDHLRVAGAETIELG
jgi:predicted butyrate kinase (DUF1464 family)